MGSGLNIIQFYKWVWVYPPCVELRAYVEVQTGKVILFSGSLLTPWLTKTSFSDSSGQKDVVSVGDSDTDAASLVWLCNWNPYSGKSCKIKGGKTHSHAIALATYYCFLESTCIFPLRSLQGVIFGIYLDGNLRRLKIVWIQNLSNTLLVL